jgi:hypothetical protein
VPEEEMIVLADSRKWGGRCIAGISTSSGRWIRPVSALQKGQLQPFHCRVGERMPQTLDIVRFGYERRLDNPGQPENVLIDERPWALAGRLSEPDAYSELAAHVSRDRLLLGNRGHAVPEAEAEAGVEASLALVESETDTRFEMSKPEQTQGRLRPKAVFRHGRHEYALSLTEYTIAPRVRQLGPGSYGATDLGFAANERILLTVSLAEPQNGWCTKLAAAAIFLPR